MSIDLLNAGVSSVVMVKARLGPDGVRLGSVVITHSEMPLRSGDHSSPFVDKINPPVEGLAGTQDIHGRIDPRFYLRRPIILIVSHQPFFVDWRFHGRKCFGAVGDVNPLCLKTRKFPFPMQNMGWVHCLANHRARSARLAKRVFKRPEVAAVEFLPLLVELSNAPVVLRAAKHLLDFKACLLCLDGVSRAGFDRRLVRATPHAVGFNARATRFPREGDGVGIHLFGFGWALLEDALHPNALAYLELVHRIVIEREFADRTDEKQAGSRGRHEPAGASVGTDEEMLTRILREVASGGALFTRSDKTARPISPTASGGQGIVPVCRRKVLRRVAVIVFCVRFKAGQLGAEFTCGNRIEIPTAVPVIMPQLIPLKKIHITPEGNHRAGSLLGEKLAVKGGGGGGNIGHRTSLRLHVIAVGADPFAIAVDREQSIVATGVAVGDVLPFGRAANGDLPGNHTQSCNV